MIDINGHTPVMFEECINGLKISTGSVIADGTLGGGGHTEGILSTTDAKVIGIDKDLDAIERCKVRLAAYSDRITYVHDDYKNILSIAERLGIDGIDGVLLDLGVSSYQLDIADRGFSYGKEAPLDMRMDKTQSFRAFDIVNDYDERELTNIIKKYGEERFASSIARAIVKERKQKAIDSTTELAEIIKNAIPAKFRRTGPHPARRTFQALRIEVNGELDGLKSAIMDYIDLLNEGGRIAVITFHSLEDRIVKEAFKEAENPCICPKEFPVCVCGRKPKGKVITRKPIEPSEAELEVNARARSAKLRIFEKHTAE